MSDYLYQFEDGSASEHSTDEDNPSEYSLTEKTDLDELDGMLNEREINKNKYNNLIDDKYLTIIQFNSGKMDTDIYFASISKINRELELIDLEDIDIEQTLMNKEIEFKTMLDEYELKIKQSKRNQGSPLDSNDIKRIKALKYLIEQLQEKYSEIEQETETEPIEPDIFETMWDSMDFYEQYEIKNLTEIVKQIDAPKRINFKTDEEYQKAFEQYKILQKIDIPLKKDFATNEEYQNAKNIFYEHLAIFLPGYFDKYLIMEKGEIDTLAKKLGIPKPLPDKLDQFYKDMVQLLPVYIYKMKIRSIGIEQELLSEDSLTKQLQNEIRNLDIQQKDLWSNKVPIEKVKKLQKTAGILKKRFETEQIEPVQLDEDDKQRTNQSKILKSILKKMEPDYLINCIYSSNAQFKKNEEKQVKIPSGKTLKIEGFIKEHGMKQMSPEEIKNYNLTKSRRELLTELLEQSKYFSERKAFKESKNFKELPITPKIKVNESIRKNSKARLVISFKKDVPIELEKNIIPIVEKMEYYVFNLTQNLMDYIGKIEDILFILDNFNFKQKILTEQINVLQIVLFEKEISDEARIHVFPVKISVRKNITMSIRNQLYLCKTFKSRILTNIITKNLSRRLELLLFNISTNESNYIFNTNKILVLISIKCNEFISGKITNEMLLAYIATGKLENVNVVDYSSFTLNQIETLIGQEKEKIKELNLLLRKFSAKHYTGEFIYLWTPPSNVSREDVFSWNKLKEQLILSLKSTRPFTRKFNNYISMFIQKLNNIRKILDKKYKLYEEEKIGKIANEINTSEEKVKMLSNTQFTKLAEQIDTYKKRYIAFLKFKYTQPPPAPFKPRFYQTLNENMIKEVVQAYKRKLLTDTLQSQPAKNKLIELLELHDLNKLYKNTIIDGMPMLDQSLYILIEKKLKVSITQIIPDILSKFYKTSLNEMLTFFKLNVDLPTLTDKLKELKSNWPKEYTISPFIDFYGQDTFLTLLESVDNLMFYDSKLIRNFNKLVKDTTPPGKSLFRKPGVLFNETTGKFGTEEAGNGKLFFVDFLDKDGFTGQPLNQYKVEMEKDPRTGLFIPVNRITQKRGKYPFILRELGTKQVNETFKIWTEVPQGSVKYYTLDYDSCSRFTEPISCNQGKGINNKDCLYDPVKKLCKIK